ncbi:MAG: hypothetical protein JW739_04145 [Opitutales bacterium]|nr:hypothetical protein [Opitutales bacterium]
MYQRSCFHIFRMLVLLGLIALECTSALVAQEMPEEPVFESDWVEMIPPQPEAYRHRGSGLLLPKYADTFQLVKSSIDSDLGGSSFTYRGNSGMAIVFFYRFSEIGLDVDDPNAAMRYYDMLNGRITQGHAEADVLESFITCIDLKGISYSGKGISYFIPDFRGSGQPAYSYLFMYQVNDFLIYVRASSPTPGFEEDFIALLKQIGAKIISRKQAQAVAGK